MTYRKKLPFLKSAVAALLAVFITLLAVGCTAPEITPDCSAGHTPEVIAAKPATCVETGLTEGSRCAVCSEILKAQETVAATGVHVYENGACKDCGKAEPTPSAGLAFTLREDGQSYELSGIGECTDLYVVVPRTYEGKPVTKIGDCAFAYCSELIGIEILPGNLTEIGTDAFCACHELASLSIPEGITSIGICAFSFCKKLTTVTLPSTLKEIAPQAFARWEGLTHIEIPEGITTLCHATFRECPALESVTLPDTLETIEYYAFDSCVSLRELILPDGLNSIATPLSSDPFEALEHVSIGSGLAGIDCSLFSGMPNLSRISVSKENSTYYESGGCLIESATKTLVMALPNATIPADGSVTTIGWAAFLVSPRQTSITIPEGVVTITDCAFAGCDSLKSVSLPSTLREMGVQLFVHCPNLTTVTIREGITKIPEASFMLAEGLTSFEIPGSVTVIEQLAFESCYALTSVTIPKSVVEIGHIPFSGCSSLTDIDYEGTMAEWDAIAKSEEWNLSHWILTVHCTDGDVVEVIE